MTILGALPGTMLPAGPPGPAAWLTPIPWQPHTQYYEGPPASTVLNLGSTYVCTNTHISGFIFDPTQWALVAAVGAPGIGDMSFQGPWNAATNLPFLQSGQGIQGVYYKVSVAGTTLLDGNATWQKGDFVAFNGATWDKFTGSSQTFSSLTVTPVGRVLPSPQPGTLYQAGNADGTITRQELVSFGAKAHFSGIRYNGTLAAPAALAANDEIVGFNGWGYNGTAVSNQATLRLYAAEAWAAGHLGTYFRVGVTPIGSTTIIEGFSVENDGSVLIPPTVTGGSKGTGTLNAAGLYVNGVAAIVPNLVTVGDANAVIAVGTRTVATNAALTAPRTWTLPSAAAYDPGRLIQIRDSAGAITAANTLTVLRAGSDTINGGTSMVLNSAYAGLDLVSDGVSKWTAAVATAVLANIAADSMLANPTNATGAPAAVLIPYTPPQGRLTLATGVPVMTSSVAGATSVLYTPDQGNQIPLPNANGGGYIMTAFPELANVLANSAVGNAGPAAAAASSVYDLFVWNPAGTPVLTRSPAWTNATTRSMALVRNNGLLVNAAAITNGPGIGLGVYVGTIATNAAATVDFIFGGSGSGGVAAVLNVWNAFNRRSMQATVVDTHATYTYTPATKRAAQASTTNRITFVSGLAEEAIVGNYSTAMATVNVVAANASGGIGLDATNSFYNSIIAQAWAASAGTSAFTGGLPVLIAPQLGQHFLQAVEASDGSNGNSFNANANNTLQAILRM